MPVEKQLQISEACESNRDTASIKRIRAAIQEADTAIENLWKALERGQAADMITERIEKRQHEKEELQAQLAVEMAKQVTLTAPQVRAYLYSLRQGDKNDENIKRGIINIFLRAIYLYDDRFTMILNGSDTPITIDDILLDEIEEGLEGDLTSCEGCSSLVADAPPKYQLIPPYNRRYLLFLTGFYNGKRCCKISVDILLDLHFQLMLHYKQARGAGRKSLAPAPDDTGIRLSGAAVHRRTGLPI